MAELTNAERAAAVAARESKAPAPPPRQHLDSAERIRADSIQSASANLEAAKGLLKQHARNLAINPQGDAAWAAYGRVWSDIERQAKTLATLTGQDVVIPERMVRAVLPLKTIRPGDYVDTKPAEQPSWMSDSVKRTRRSQQIERENERARRQRWADANGSTIMRDVK